MSKTFRFDYCKVTRVIDGDTIEAVVDTGFGNTHTDHFRLQGIDAPEKRGLTRPEGMLAKAFLEDLILDKEVSITSFGGDKYGRWLADIYIEGVYVNESMVLNGHAKLWGE